MAKAKKIPALAQYYIRLVTVVLSLTPLHQQQNTVSSICAEINLYTFLSCFTCLDNSSSQPRLHFSILKSKFDLSRYYEQCNRIRIWLKTVQDFDLCNFWELQPRVFVDSLTWTFCSLCVSQTRITRTSPDANNVPVVCSHSSTRPEPGGIGNRFLEFI